MAQASPYERIAAVALHVHKCLEAPHIFDAGTFDDLSTAHQTNHLDTARVVIKALRHEALRELLTEAATWAEEQNMHRPSTVTRDLARRLRAALK